MFYELRSLGYSLAVGWRCEPLAYGDATIYDALLDAAGGDDAAMTDDELASFQAWRRAAKVMWVSELFCVRTVALCDLGSTRISNAVHVTVKWMPFGFVWLRLDMVARGHQPGAGAWAYPSLHYGRFSRLATCSGVTTRYAKPRS